MRNKVENEPSTYRWTVYPGLLQSLNTKSWGNKRTMTTRRVRSAPRSHGTGLGDGCKVEGIWSVCTRYYTERMTNRAKTC
jgi:hypothetical protein